MRTKIIEKENFYSRSKPTTCLLCDLDQGVQPIQDCFCIVGSENSNGSAQTRLLYKMKEEILQKYLSCDWHIDY